MKSATTTIVAVTALVIAILSAIACAIMFPIAFTTLSVSQTLIQSGNVTIDLFNTNVLDTLNTTYRLYYIPNNYVIEIDPLARELIVPPATVTDYFVQVRLHYFSPPIVPLSGIGSRTYSFPLLPHNLNAISLQGPCFDAPATCVMSISQGSGILGQNSLITDIESDANGYFYFLMQTIDASPQDWANYTVSIDQKLSLSIFAA